MNIEELVGRARDGQPRAVAKLISLVEDAHPLLREVETEARRRGLSKSELIRNSLEATLRRKRAEKPVTCLDLMGDLVGSFRGPRGSDHEQDDCETRKQERTV